MSNIEIKSPEEAEIIKNLEAVFNQHQTPADKGSLIKTKCTESREDNSHY